MLGVLFLVQFNNFFWPDCGLLLELLLTLTPAVLMRSQVLEVGTVGALAVEQKPTRNSASRRNPARKKKKPGRLTWQLPGELFLRPEGQSLSLALLLLVESETLCAAGHRPQRGTEMTDSVCEKRRNGTIQD